MKTKTHPEIREAKTCVHCKEPGVKQLSNGDSYCQKHYEEDGIYVDAKLNREHSDSI